MCSGGGSPVSSPGGAVSIGDGARIIGVGGFESRLESRIPARERAVVIGDVLRCLFPQIGAVLNSLGWCSLLGGDSVRWLLSSRA